MYYLFFLIKPRVIMMMIRKKKTTLSLTGAYVILSSVAGASAAPPTATERIIKGIFVNQDHLFQRHRQLRESTIPGLFPRNLARDKQEACDSAFLSCLPSMGCVDCFATLELEKIDWAGVTSETECADVVSFLNKGGYCSKLTNDRDATKAFCNTFDACVVWTDDGTDSDPSDPEGLVNCTALTTCDWPGMKKTWLGDGICHDNMHGCYNTEICGYDGGDCCMDTCKGGETGDTAYKTCGQDGFACRDPASLNCDTSVTLKCRNKPDEKKKANDVTCKDTEQKYRLIMYDSFGDGWDQTTLTIKAGSSKIFDGSLLDGAEGTEYICLSKEPTCYSALTSGGTWGVEVGWEIKTMTEGSPAIVGSGAPSDCDFPMAGDDCEKTCEGKPTEDPTDDPDYKSFKELFNCISDKCVIQLGACKEDPVCERCFVEDAPEYCYGVDDFNAVLQCTLCQCTDRSGSEVCEKKNGPGSIIPPGQNQDEDNSSPRKCSGAETMKGAKAVMEFSQCSKMDDIGVMVTNFDQSNFGQLDQFETCAHSFNDEANHGGHTALSCMQILYNAMTIPVSDENDRDPPKEAIMSLAKDLYQNGEGFCDCAKKASENCPLCPSFMNFKSLLYESLDACTALDQIDCDSWAEFWKPCQDNVEAEFGSADLEVRDQCDYMKRGCGGAGAFPAFRRLDCAGEIDSEAWSFYRKYEKSCLKGEDGKPPNDTPIDPVPKPSVAPAFKPTKIPASSPTTVPYVPSDDNFTPKPYVPSDSRGSGSSAGSKSHWFRNFLMLGALCGGGYYFYKKRYLGEQFNFMQYRRVRNFGYGMEDESGGMYSNLNSSTSFEPPSLPPTPQMIGAYDQGGHQMQTFGGLMS